MWPATRPDPDEDAQYWLSEALFKVETVIKGQLEKQDSFSVPAINFAGFWLQRDNDDTADRIPIRGDHLINLYRHSDNILNTMVCGG
ncbi:hypothetical protein BVC80_8987g9 [Macleaya cordata]|uniref:Uncharacterized protein n=1 Tax=Macleaya cordata TaxID=56857 RepID=A0A200QJ49_MACCD|nr:hypothetical protein BVC80_8987g9 [Macleaya cordata]